MASYNNLLSLATVLFIMTLISERIANFCKLWLSDTRILFPQGRWKKMLNFFAFSNTSIKKINPREEKEREFRILRINIFFGLLVALSYRADLFQMIAHIDHPTSHIGWTNFSTDYDASDCGPLFLLGTFFGCIFTALFLSFGSKFWHDMIDLIMQLKNYKQMLTTTGNQEVQQQQQQQEFGKLAIGDQNTILNAAIKANYDTWKVKYPNINGCMAGTKTTAGIGQGQRALVFSVATKVPADQLSGSNTIPDSIYYNGYIIPTDVVQRTDVVSQANIVYGGQDTIPPCIGTNVSVDKVNAYGSAGIRVKSQSSEQYYLLSCFHVLCFDQIQNGMFNNTTEVEYVPSSAEALQATIPGFLYRSKNNVDPVLTGKLIKGVYSSVMDAALVEIQQSDLDNTTFTGTDGKNITLSATDTVSLDQLNENDLVVCYGCVSGSTAGHIKAIDGGIVDITVKGPNGNMPMRLSGLLYCSQISADGDSGAPVFTAGGKLIGIIVAGDNSSCSYVLPYEYIVNRLHVTLN